VRRRTSSATATPTARFAIGASSSGCQAPAKAFEQAAGLSPHRRRRHLDTSGVHPEAYPVVERILRARSGATFAR
jgi:hypothetical protein